MKTNKNGLDEMQKAKRNSIGNQMFVILFWALLLDCALYAAGIRWLEYPSNTMAIIMAGMGVYLIRLLASNAYLPPKSEGRKTVKFLILAIVVSIMLVVSGSFLFRAAPAEGSNGSVAWILFILSAVGLLVSLVVAFTKNANDKKDRDD
ncbi:MAG: hypothetical protein AAGU74_08095 [Bacillota bacterium]